MWSRLKSWIRQHFGFSKGQSQGVLVILLITVLALAVSPAYRYYSLYYARPAQQEQDIRLLDEWLAACEQNQGAELGDGDK